MEALSAGLHKLIKPCLKCRPGDLLHLANDDPVTQDYHIIKTQYLNESLGNVSFEIVPVKACIS